jgi:hypothetical protein
MSAREAFALMEHILNPTLQEGFSDDRRYENLIEWNTKQILLFKQLEKGNLIEHNDIQMWAKFGAWFYIFVDDNRRYPELSDALDWFESLA